MLEPLKESIEAEAGGLVIVKAGSLWTKMGWFRGAPGKLVITGERIDAPAAPVLSHIPAGYGESGFQSTGVVFTSEGCWEITGRIENEAESDLTFVVDVRLKR